MTRISTNDWMLYEPMSHKIVFTPESASKQVKCNNEF